MDVSRTFGEVKEVRLEGGVIRYREQGTGPVLVFVHGILANGVLWREVVPHLARDYRCVVPDLPLGGHSVPMSPDADLSPSGIARVVAGFLEALDLRDVTLVGNDTGGAICQILLSRHPGSISRLVLTNCDAYEAFLPALLKPLQYGARFFGRRFIDVLSWTLRARFAQRALLQTVAARRMETTVLDAYFAPLLQNPEVRRDLSKFLAGISNRYTLDASRSFGSFCGPVLIAWGEDDIFFSSRLARRLQRDFPDAVLQTIPGSRAFVPEDQPEKLSDLIRDFLVSRQTG